MRHLLIDGYNVIHAWAELCAGVSWRSAVARERLVEAVRVIHDVEGLRLTVVFDGAGDQLTVEHPNPSEPTLSILYAPAGITADGIIGQLAEKAGRRGEGELLSVVTRDTVVADSMRAVHGSALTPDDLEAWVTSCQRRLGDVLKQRRKAADRLWQER